MCIQNVHTSVLLADSLPHPAYFNQLVMTLRFFRMLSSNPFLFLSLYDANSSGSEIFCFGGWKKAINDVYHFHPN